MSLLLIACDSKSNKNEGKSSTQSNTLYCKNFGEFGSDKYAENLAALIEAVGWTNGKTSIEEFALDICSGEIENAGKFVKFGHIKPNQAIEIASLLGIKYSPPAPNSAITPSKK